MNVKLAFLFLCFGLLVGCSSLGDVASQLGSSSSNTMMGQDGFEMSNAIGAGADLVKAATLSDDQVRSMSLQAAQQLDSQERLAPPQSEYAKRLERLTRNHTYEDGLNLNFKVYLSDEVNAFALADGSIRFYSGLMDLMNDDELMAVVGHEIGHVKMGHSKSAMRWAYGLSAARKGVASQGGVAGTLAAGEIGFILEKLIDAQYNQDQETESDDYGLQFLTKHGYSPYGSVTAMRKLAMLGGEASMFSSHPAPEARAQRIEAMIQGDVPPAPTQYASAQAQPQAAQQQQMAFREPAAPQPVQPQVKVTKTPMQAVAKKTKRGVVAEAKVAPGYYIQVAADPTPEAATSRAKKLQNLNARAVIQEAVVNGNTFFRVLVGPYIEEPKEQLIMLKKDDLGVAKGTPFLKHFQ